MTIQRRLMLTPFASSRHLTQSWFASEGIGSPFRIRHLADRGQGRTHPAWPEARLAKLDLLVLDELGYVPASKVGAELLFDVISTAYERTSLMVTTNLLFDHWTEVLGSERLTGATLDRLTHRCQIIETRGESYRLRDAKARVRKPAVSGDPGPKERVTAGPPEATARHHDARRSVPSEPCRSWAPSANSSNIFAQNARRSSGLRLDTSPRSVWTSSSTHVPPALVMSVRRLGHEVSVLPRRTPASMSVHGPWQITATGLPDSKNARTKSTTRASVRSRSGFATPPGSTSAS
jgi:hypothetical protein